MGLVKIMFEGGGEYSLIYNIYTPRQGASRLDCICLAALSTIISNIMQRLLVLLYQHYSDIKCPFKYTVQVHSYKNKLRTVNVSSKG